MFREKIEYIKKEFRWSKFLSLIFFMFFLSLILDALFIFFLNIFINFSHLEIKTLFKINIKELISNNFLLFFVVQLVLFFGSLIIALIFTVKGKSGNKFLSYEKKHKEYGVSEFLIDERHPVPYKNLKKFKLIFPKTFKEPFYMVRSQINPQTKKYEFNGIETKTAVHAIVIGSTGSGKTQKFIIPNAILNARLPKEEKPSMVFTDPKGELYAVIGGELEVQGYKVMKLNLRNVMDSIKYNPLANIWDFFLNGLEYEKNNFSLFLKTKFLEEKNVWLFKCLTHGEVKCQECLALTKKEIWVDNLENYFFIDAKTKNDYLLLKKSDLTNKAYEEVADLCDVLCNPGNETQNKSFYQGAQGIIKGVILAFLELKKAGKLITKEQFNMVTITKLISNQTELSEWFEDYGKENPTSNAWGSASGVIKSSEAARGNYFSMAKNCLKMFEDKSLEHILVDNEINLFDFANVSQPQALFLIIPDDRTDKHPIASLIISQLYKANTFVASQNLVKKGKDELDRSVLFFLDEFGNIPKISQFESMITVARSRKMFFVLVIQSYQQLKNKYGDDSETIKSNCSLTIFLGTDSNATVKEISSRIGETTVKTKSLTGNSKKDKEAAVTMRGKALMEMSEIDHLDALYSILLFSKQMPSIVKFELAYRIKDTLNLNKKTKKIINPKPIDFENKYWFNICQTSTSSSLKTKRTKISRFRSTLPNPTLAKLEEIEKQIRTLKAKNSLTPSDRKILSSLLKKKEEMIDFERDN